MFSIRENAGQYVVECLPATPGVTSRNRNIQDRRFRIEAVDLIGSYILFLQSPLKSEPELFQLFSDAAQLHYTAYLSEMEQEVKDLKDGQVIIFRCKKDHYHITEATYQRVDPESLYHDNYRRRKDVTAVGLLYRHGDMGLRDWLMVEKDFLTGDCLLPGLVRKLHNIPDRMERSMIQEENLVGKYGGDVPSETCYRIFFLEEMVTALPVSQKGEAYKSWIQALSKATGVLPDMLGFSVKVRSRDRLPDSPLFTELIEAFPGALSPFGVRVPMDNVLYDEAVKAYSQSDFARAAELLTDYTNENGFSPQALNLLGASLRFLGKPDRALPYFLLCLKAAPSTPYLAGNLALVFKDLGYPKLTDLCRELLLLSFDNWSQKEINSIITIQ